MRLIALIVWIAALSLAGCGESSGGGDLDASTDSDSDTDADTDTDTDSDTDTDADDLCVDDSTCIALGLVCNENWGICVVSSCEGEGNFTPCETVTDPDRSYDICIDEVCQSPGCGDEPCNAPGPHFPLADTAQFTCSDDTAEMTCPDPGEDFYGQDAQYGWDVDHYYLDRFDCDLSTATNPVVLDNVTGLTWQGCPLGYSGEWCETADSVTAFSWADAVAECDSLSWGGYADWRLPDEQELMTIVDYGKPYGEPAIDPVAFPATPSEAFWSSSSYAQYDGTECDTAWEVEFHSGNMGDMHYKFQPNRARCVRGGSMEGQALVPSILSGERVVEDTVTGLMWQGCAAGMTGDDCDSGAGAPNSKTWSAALAYCEGLWWGGYDDWRLPDVKELSSIFDTHVFGPCIDSTAFPASEGSYYWTSTSSIHDVGGAWAVHFNYGGDALTVEKGITNPVRCVRAGP